MFPIIVLLLNQTAFELRGTNWWLDVLWGFSGPEALKQPQTITLPPPCLTAGVMFVF